MDRHAHALIVADGDMDAAALVRLAAGPGRTDGLGRMVAHPAATDSAATDPAAVPSGRPMIVAADGGAARCLAAGLRPDIVVGDFDSLPAAAQARLRDLGVEMVTAEPDKDESDTELCLLVALRRAATRITILGALGILRPEHSIANLLLLADARFDDVELAIEGHGSRTWRVGTPDGPGEARIEGGAGDYVSLFALDRRVEGVRTDGLRFPLRDEALLLGPSRGLSNELTADRGRVTTRRGRLLVVHTDRSVEAGPRPGAEEA
jgi:thiamine pyrophosphokinase